MSEQLPEMNEQAASQLNEEVELDIGKTLQTARKALNISLEQAAQQLRLDVRLLKAIEADDFAALPGAAYAYGYLRSYTKLLKIQEEEILRRFLEKSQVDSNALIPEHITFAVKNKAPSFSFGQIVMLAVFLIIVIAAVIWMLLGNAPTLFTSNPNAAGITRKVANVAMDAPVNTKVETLTKKNISAEEKKPAALPDKVEVKHAEIVTAPKSKKVLQLSYNKASWTEIRDASGATLIYRMVHMGEHLALEGKPPYTILLGYAPGVSVTYNGAAYDTKPYRRDDIAYFRIGKKRPVLATEK